MSTRGSTTLSKKESIVLISNNGRMLLNFWLDFIISLVEANYTVYCLAPDYSASELEKIVEIKAVPVNFFLNRSSINPFSDLRSFVSILSCIKRINPDILIFITAKPIVWGILAAKAAICNSTKVVMFTGLGYAFIPTKKTKQIIIKSILSTMYKLTLKYSDKIIFQNIDDYYEIASLCNLPSEKCSVIKGTGVNFNKWSFHPPKCDPITFSLVARLLREKGILDFLEAASYLKKQNPNIRFYLIGGLDSNPSSLQEDDILPYTKDNTVEWLGFVDVTKYLPETSVLVLPSYYREGIPRSIKEAMATGRPIITTDVPGCRETVIDGYNGFLIPPQNVHALVNAMQKFIEQPSLISLMGYRSYQMAVELFDVKKINAQYLKLLREC